MNNESILFSFRKAFHDSTEKLPPKGPVTIHQRALFSIWLICLGYYWLQRSFVLKNSRNIENKEDVERSAVANSIVNTGDAVIKITSDRTSAPTSPVRSQITFKDVLLSMLIVGGILMYYFFCDYLHYLPKAERTYNRDLYLFLIFLLLAVAVYFTSTEIKGPGKLLNRDQTEEWKGWMQVMFVWYHYFRAKETYNAVRIYIAAYVWMTGFGNFSFFWVKKDYSLRRLLKMIFRLNFLVVLTTLVLDNSYMLYYICAMHTFWFLSVYAMMRPYHQYNENTKVMTLKFIIYFGIIFLIFDVPGVATKIFSPLVIVLNYNGSLYEWIFRSRLDHYVTLVGMICAYNHPRAEKLLNHINQHKFKNVILLAISSLILLIIGIWYSYVFTLPKYPYNKLHPYTSFIPILAFIFFRNSTSWLRSRYLHLFAIMGKITLETYISQLHIYLQSNAAQLLVYVPNYPLVSFTMNTIIYLFLSNVLFNATVTINEYLFPNEAKKMWKNILICVMVAGVGYFIGFATSF